MDLYEQLVSREEKAGIDPTHEVGDEAVKATTVDFTSDENTRLIGAGNES